MDKSKKIFYEVMHDVNILFGKIFSYNYELLALCNDNNYTPTFDEIFDFYITSNAMSFLKNFYFNYIESPGILLNGRCILEGLALKSLYKNDGIDDFNVEFLKKQDSIMEYREYKKFKDIMELVTIPETLKSKYDEAVKFYRDTLTSYSRKEVDSIINSQIPFLCNPKMNYRQIIEEQLGKEIANYYSMLSIYIHPRSNELINVKQHTFILLDIFTLIKNTYNYLPEANINLTVMADAIFANKDAESFNDLIKSECTHFENIQADYDRNFGKNYVSDTFHIISMLYQEMMFDTLFGMCEQVKSKFKVMLELLAGFNEVYIEQEDVENSYRLLQFHEKVSLSIAFDDINEVNDNLKVAYDFYSKKYPFGVAFEEFSHKYKTNAGFTIDECGKTKTLTQLVNQLCDIFEDEKDVIQVRDTLKLNYVESQMLSHANGYMWYANSGAWGDSLNVYMNVNNLLSFLCFYLSHIYKDGYEQTKEYKDKKTSNIFKQAGKFIRDNTKNIYDILIKKEGKLYSYLQTNTNQ